MAQSKELAAETATMRSFDAALQKIPDLPERAQGRVLRYVADQIAEQIAEHTRRVQDSRLEAASAGGDSGFGELVVARGGVTPDGPAMRYAGD